MIIFDLSFAAIFLGIVAALYKQPAPKPQRPTVLTMPPKGTLEYQAARWGVRAAKMDMTDACTSDIVHAQQLAAGYLAAAEETRGTTR